jgi:hypothetical protein
MPLLDKFNISTISKKLNTINFETSAANNILLLLKDFFSLFCLRLIIKRVSFCRFSLEKYF